MHNKNTTDSFNKNEGREKLLRESAEYFHQQNLDEAKKRLEQLVASANTSAEVYSNLSYICYLKSDIDAAIQYGDLAIKTDPTFMSAYANTAIALLAIQRIDDAIQVLTAGLQQDSSYAALHVNLGIAFQQRHQLSRAIHHLQTAIQLEPSLVDSYCNLASCLQDSAKNSQAIHAYQHALALNPQHRAAISNYLLSLQYHPDSTSESLRREAISATASINQLVPATHNKPIAKEHSRLRIGFVSADFRAHPVGYFLKDVFIALANERCDLYCYYNSIKQVKDDSFTNTFQQHAKKFSWVAGKNDQQLQEEIIEDEIDVLIDLAGHTAGNRLGVFALRAANKQYSWLGFPATTAIKNMDAVILSQDLITAATPHFFTENVIALTGPQFLYSPPDYLPNVSPSPCEKNQVITFGSFNNLGKLNDEVLVTWAKILHKVTGSRLVLKWKSFDDPTVCDYFFRRFHSLGIARDRLLLRGASPHRLMLEEYGEIDIALDPFPFGGALTSYEAAWMGLPIVTLYSERPLSRQTYSLNKAIELGELSAATPATYIETAVRLAQDKQRLRSLRGGMRERLMQSATQNASALAQALLANIGLVQANNEVRNNLVFKQHRLDH